MVGIVIHLGEQFFGGAPDHVVAAGRARARVRGSGLKPNFQGVPSQTFVILSNHRKREKSYIRKYVCLSNKKLPNLISNNKKAASPIL